MTEVFDVHNTHCVQKTWIKNFNGTVPYVTASSENNSVDSYVEYDPSMMDRGNAIVIGGKTFVVTYQKNDFFSNDSHNLILRLKGHIGNERVYLFLSAIVTRCLGSQYSWGNSVSFKKIQKDKISLPVLPDGTPDFAYMEAYIRELEAARIRELEAARIRELDKYLKAAGFDDCELTKDERRAVENWKNGNVKLGAFTIGKLFDIHPTAAYKLTNRELLTTPGDVPLLSNSSQHNGIAAYVGLKATESGNKITFSDTTTSEAIFYQPQDFVGYPHVQGLYARNGKWQENHLLYLTSVFRAAAAGRFDYATKFTRKIAAEMQVPIPIAAKGEIDYPFMETFVRATMKLAIRGVVEWKDREIAATKRVVGGKV